MGMNQNEIIAMATIHTQCLMELFDQLETEPVYKHKFKNKAKAFLNEAELYFRQQAANIANENLFDEYVKLQEFVSNFNRELFNLKPVNHADAYDYLKSLNSSSNLS